MSLSNLVPSMFHRRLMLLLACTVGATGVLAAQLARLTLVQGEMHRTDAEAKLVRRQWIQTLRGRILDRQGRVLAQDRPSFDLAVEYPVITGEWARQRAYAAARKVYGGRRWGQLSAEEREQIVAATYLPLYAEHLDLAWSLFARTSGLPYEKVAERRAAVVEQVESMFRAIRTRRWDAEFEAFLADGGGGPGGRGLDEDAERRMHSRIKQPIREQSAPHVIAPRVPDDVGFAFLRLAEEQVKIRVPRPDEAGGGGEYEDTVGLIPGLSVVNAHDRDYPFERVDVDVDTSTLPGPMRGEGAGTVKKIAVEGVATHVVGWMRNEAQKEHVEERLARLEADPGLLERATAGGAGDRGQYMPGDSVGAAGIEASAEHELRGLRGLRIEQLETGEQTFLDPSAGRDVQLTIDVALQARVQAVMTPELGLATVQPWHGKENPTMPLGTPLNGGAVVLEVDTGDILALVSTPGIPRRVLRDDPASLFDDEVNQPFFHRAISRPYPPGSIAKALVLCGAVKLGALNLDHHIECNGHLLPNSPGMLRCWIYKSYNGNTHSGQLGGALSAIQALTVSCNIYFFTLGQRLGPEGIEAVYRMFGVGDDWGLGIGHEFKGLLGVIGNDGKVQPVTPGDAIQMGIGQGPVAWTALHAADAFATIARGGVRIKPRVALGGATAGGGGSEPPVDLGLDPRVISEALKGLEGSVNESLGTGHHVTVQDPQTGQERREVIFNAPGVQVWGKTGTAAAPDLKIDADGDGARETILRSGDHSWFVVLVGRKGEDRPRYAISVMMEYAGSGGKVSGPIVNQIIHALIAEGYL